MQQGKDHHVFVEKLMLSYLKSPLFIDLYWSFQDKNNLYFILEFADRGELSSYISKKSISINCPAKIDIPVISYLSAQIVIILEYLHSNGIAHRDFKPENLLLTSEGKIKCIDFGTADVFHLEGVNDDLFQKYNKIKQKFAKKTRDSILERLTSLSQDRKSFVGTTFYIAPEMILDQNSVDYSADLWAFGIILYRLAKNKYIFNEVNDYLIFEKIKNSSFELDNDLDSDIRDLILQLLVKDPKKRLGAGQGGFAKLKAHSFFQNIDWDNISVMESPLKSKSN